MTLDEAKKILEDNGYIVIDEGVRSNIGKALAAGALAASSVFGNSNVQDRPVNDKSFGKNTVVHYQDRYDFDSDRYGVPKSYRLDNGDAPQVMDVRMEIELTKRKILATPDSMLKKFGKNNIDSIARYMVETANKYNIDIDILLAMAATETNFDNNGKSGAGAIGMMQITPKTAYDVHTRLQGLDKETFDFNSFKDMRKNIDNAGRILANLSKSHKNVIEMMLADYNGGRAQATNYRSYVSGSKFDRDGRPAKPLAAETREYIEKCMGLYKLYKRVQKNFNA